MDEHSIKVEGTGAATISEVSVDLLPNRDVFEDVYPEEDDEEDEDESESESEPESLKSVEKKMKQLLETLFVEKEKIGNATDRLIICENYGKSVSTEHLPPEKLQDVLRVYNRERQTIFSDHQAATRASEKIQEEIAKVEKEKTKLLKELAKAQLKKQKAKTKLKEKATRKRAEIIKEKRRIKAERESFWARKVYRITISLEVPSLTPDSSRRSSVTEGDFANLATTTFHQPETLKEGSVSLSISYITYSASWSPRYDLNLNSLKCSGILEYNADLKNTTSETWRDAKVILSTSQTTFSGLNEEIPTLYPWHVRLMRGVRNTDMALMSQNELDMKRKAWNNIIDQSNKPRHLLFGVDESAQREFVLELQRKKMSNIQEHAERVDMLKSKSSAPIESVNTIASHFGAPAGSLVTSRVGRGGGALFGSAMAQPEAAGWAPPTSYGNAPQTRGSAFKDNVAPELNVERMARKLSDSDSSSGQDPNSLVFEEGAWEESGMTTTYDVPGLKTLAPSNSTIKHKIAKVDFKNIIFSHIVIGKLRQVAFLKARLRNASKITLLKGPLGLSLDGSFLGQTTFPRCSAGESFSLPLGVDPAIQISYAKPTVHRSKSGIFSKEDCNVFSRSITISNTKNAPVELTVLDQVPVSEDERLKIGISVPRGLKPGDSVKTGINATPSSVGATLSINSAQTARASVYGSENGKEVDRQAKWGAAEATAKSGGEVAWNVKLNPACGVKLVLEYEAAFPSGECMV